MAELRYVKGLEGLLDTLKALPPEIVSKGGGPVRTSLRKAGVVFQKAYQENIRAIVDEPNKDGSTPANSRTLEKAVIVSRRKPRPGFKGEIFAVRVKRGARAPNGQSANKYGGVIEFGYEGVPAKAPMRKAFETNKDQALTVFVSEMQKRVEAAAKKARKQGLR
jgi:HK97 gp10 family phage protein